MVQDIATGKRHRRNAKMMTAASPKIKIEKSLHSRISSFAPLSQNVGPPLVAGPKFRDQVTNDGVLAEFQRSEMDGRQQRATRLTANGQRQAAVGQQEGQYHRFGESAQYMDDMPRPSELDLAQMDPAPGQYHSFGENAQSLDDISNPAQMTHGSGPFPAGSQSTYGIPHGDESHAMHRIWEVIEGASTALSVPDSPSNENAVKAAERVEGDFRESQHQQYSILSIPFRQPS
ncbi:MAG: hypothetical protein Q9170_004388 [Blastenia crenularia]